MLCVIHSQRSRAFSGDMYTSTEYLIQYGKLSVPYETLYCWNYLNVVPWTLFPIFGADQSELVEYSTKSIEDVLFFCFFCFFLNFSFPPFLALFRCLTPPFGHLDDLNPTATSDLLSCVLHVCSNCLGIFRQLPVTKEPGFPCMDMELCRAY